MPMSKLFTLTSLSALVLAVSGPAQAQSAAGACADAQKSIQSFLDVGDVRDASKKALTSIHDTLGREGLSGETCGSIKANADEVIEIEQRYRDRMAEYDALKEGSVATASKAVDALEDGAESASGEAASGDGTEIAGQATSEVDSLKSAASDDSKPEEVTTAAEDKTESADATTSEDAAATQDAAETDEGNATSDNSEKTVETETEDAEKAPEGGATPEGAVKTAEGEGNQEESAKTTEGEAQQDAAKMVEGDSTSEETAKTAEGESDASSKTAESETKPEGATETVENKVEPDDTPKAAEGAVESEEAVKTAEDEAKPEDAEKTTEAEAKPDDTAKAAEGEMQESEKTAEGDAKADDDTTVVESEDKAASGETEQATAALSAAGASAARSSNDGIDSMTVESIVGRTVYGGDGEELGEVDMVIIRDGAPYLIVSKGGFLGIAETEIGVEASRFSVSSQSDVILLPDMTVDTFDELEDWDEGDFPQAEGSATIGSLRG